MKRMVTIAALLVFAHTTTGFSKELQARDVPKEPESPAKVAAAQSRVNRYFKNKVASPKLKECWGRLTGEGVIATDITYRKTGGAWTFESVEATESTIPQDQVSAALQCLQDAAKATSFPVDPGSVYEKDASEFVLRWTWPVPLKASGDTRSGALINLGGTTTTSCQACVFKGSPPYGLICKAVTSGGYKVCQLYGTPPSNSCAVDKACLSGSFGGLR